MARAPNIAPPKPIARPRWKRVTRRPWVRPDDPGSVSALLALIPSLPRPVLAALTTRMIDRMDELDGDADSEPDGDELDGSCSADDPDFHSIYSDGDPGDPDDSEEGDDDAAEEGRPPEGALKSREAHRRRIRRTRGRAVGKMRPNLPR